MHTIYISGLEKKDAMDSLNSARDYA